MRVLFLLPWLLLLGSLHAAPGVPESTPASTPAPVSTPAEAKKAAVSAPAPAPGPGPAKPLTELEKAVEEFKTQTRLLGMRAESPVKVRQAFWKSWHGRLFENLRNDIFDAVPHEIRQRGSEKSLLRRNQFGFNAAGPIHKRSTFLSVSYEGMRERISRSTLSTVATLPERTGDFSQTVDQSGAVLPIYDPGTTRPNPAFQELDPVSESNLQYLREPFPNNTIPLNRLDPAARKALAQYPAPNANVGPFNQNNYFVVSPETNLANGVIIKLDHTIREKHRIAFGTTVSNGFAGTAKLYPQAPSIDPNSPDRDFSTRRGSLNYTDTISPSTINSVSFEANADRQKSVVQGDENGTCPVYHFGYLGICRTTPNSSYVRNTFVWTDSISFKYRKNSLRAVAQLASFQVNVFAPSVPDGVFRFGSGMTSLPGIVNTGHPFASYLLGLTESAERSIVPNPSYWRRRTGLISLSDHYELRPNLNVSAGFSVDMSTPRVEKYDRQSTVDPDAVDPVTGQKGILVFANRNGYGRAFQPFHARVQPNAGLAWNPGGNSNSVLRLNVSRSYQQIPIYSNQWGTQGFNQYATYISQNTQLQPAFQLSSGLPALSTPIPNLRPDAANGTWADLIEKTGRQATYNSASISFERQVVSSLVLTVGAGHQSGRDLLVGTGSVAPNAISLDALQYRDQLNDESFRASLRPYPQYLGFEVWGLYPAGRYQRDAAYLKVDKRSTKGLSLTATYEFSKQMDDYSGPYGMQDVYNRQNEWGLTAYNAPHRFSMTYSYELPFGSNKALFSYSDWRRYLVDGWALSGISSVNSGVPLALRPQFNNTGGVVQALHVNLVPGIDERTADAGPALWFNPAAFDQPADFTTGNVSRTLPGILTPGNQNHDVSVTKRFSLDAERTVEISAMGLNFLNHANWNDPDVTIGPSSAPNVNAGKIIGSRGGRILQVGLKYSF